MFLSKIWFVKTSTRVVKYESQVVKSNPAQDFWHFNVSGNIVTKGLTRPSHKLFSLKGFIISVLLGSQLSLYLL